jgi:hypothetical protein
MSGRRQVVRRTDSVTKVTADVVASERRAELQERCHVQRMHGHRKQWWRTHADALLLLFALFLLNLSETCVDDYVENVCFESTPSLLKFNLNGEVRSLRMIIDYFMRDSHDQTKYLLYHATLLEERQQWGDSIYGHREAVSRRERQIVARREQIIQRIDI